MKSQPAPRREGPHNPHFPDNETEAKKRGHSADGRPPSHRRLGTLHDLAGLGTTDHTGKSTLALPNRKGLGNSSCHFQASLSPQDLLRDKPAQRANHAPTPQSGRKVNQHSSDMHSPGPHCAPRDGLLVQLCLPAGAHHPRPNGNAAGNGGTCGQLLLVKRKMAPGPDVLTGTTLSRYHWKSKVRAQSLSRTRSRSTLAA